MIFYLNNELVSERIEIVYSLDHISTLYPIPWFVLYIIILLYFLLGHMLCLTILWGSKATPFLIWECVFYTGGKALAAAVALPFIEVLEEDTMMANDTLISNSSSTSVPYKETKIQGTFAYSYLIVALISFFIFIWYILLFTFNKQQITDMGTSANKSKVEWNKWVVVTYIFVFLLPFCISGVEFGYGGMMPTYFHEYRGWPKPKATFLALVYELSGVASSVVIGFIAFKVKVNYLICVMQITLVCSGILLTVFQTSEPIIYAASIATGMCTGPASGVLIGWFSLLAGGSGKLHAFYWAGSAGGILAMPFIVSVAMETLSAHWFLFITLILRVTSMFTFILVTIISRMLPEVCSAANLAEKTENTGKDCTSTPDTYIDNTQL